MFDFLSKICYTTNKKKYYFRNKMKKEKKFDVVLMDMYGVIKFADGTSKNVAEVMSKWQSEGIKIYILSNTTTLNEETCRHE